MIEFEKAKEAKVIESNNNGDFFKFVNRKLSYKSGVGALRDGDEYVSDDGRKAELLNAAFHKAQQTDNGSLPKFTNRQNGARVLETVDFDMHKIYKVGRRIKPKLSKDPEGYCPFLLSKILSSLASPLSTIFQSFMSTSSIPDSWKHSIITPIFKKGLASDPNNYRPVAITSIFSKLMERVIAHDTSYFLKETGLISKEQHGFIKARSTSTNLLESVNDWTINFSSHSATDVAYIDFAKAFDKVIHSKLIHKLECYGIRGDLLKFMRNFLLNRTQCTKVGSCLSTCLNIKSGVIQGSCIGPLLFVVYINDITECLRDGCSMKLFADDIKLYTCIETTVDTDRLQGNLDNVFNWATLWQMEISIAKCAILPVGGKLLCIHNRQYVINNVVLPTVFNCRDLGVTVDRDLTFSDHVDNIVSRACIKANLIIRCFVSGDRHSLLKAFVTYVRPILEFNSSVWTPRHLGDIEKLESVQRHFTKRIAGLWDMDYNARLKALDLESLELRRLRADLIITYKIVLGYIDTDPNNFFRVMPDNDRPTRGHAFRLSVPDSNSVSEARRHFLSIRILSVWNGLPEITTDFSTLNRFKLSTTTSYLQSWAKSNRDSI